MHVRYYNITNLETGEVRQHVESREVKKILNTDLAISRCAERGMVVNGWRIEYEDGIGERRLHPFTQKTYAEWEHWCNVLRRQGK